MFLFWTIRQFSDLSVLNSFLTIWPQLSILSRNPRWRWRRWLSIIDFNVALSDLSFRNFYDEKTQSTSNFFGSLWLMILLFSLLVDMATENEWNLSIVMTFFWWKCESTALKREFCLLFIDSNNDEIIFIWLWCFHISFGPNCFEFLFHISIIFSFF